MDTASPLGDGTEVRARWSLRLLGGFELRVLLDSQRVVSLGKRECALLAYLALSPNCRQPRRKLATLLWGDTTDEAASNSLRTSVWSARRALGDAEHRFIASEGEDIVLDAAAFDVDVLAFRRLASESGKVELEAAANLYCGEFLDGLGIESEEFESWRRGETARCRDQAIDVLSRLMTVLATCGETERAIEAGTRILRLEPLHEAAARRLMRLYGESGRRGAAMQLYRTLVDALRTELDAKPEAETRAVFAEIAHGGEERTSDPIAADSRPPLLSVSTTRPTDAAGGVLRPATRPAFGLRVPLAILAGVLIVATALISYRYFALSDTNQAVVAEQKPSALQAGTISIAVLPFANMSGDATQEFFSDGITEEVTSALAKVPNLRVVARTSSFQFKGQNQDLRVVGQALGTSHLIEGSVRKVGDRVRITAQLIKVDDGTHLWSETYDRQLTDIFAIQEDIATAIAGALRVPLGLVPGERLVSSRDIAPESYQQFLLARTILRNRAGPAQFTENRYAGAIAMLEQVVARDPSYAPAWALLALMSSDPAKRETAAREAIRLDSRNAVSYVALAQVQNSRSNFVAGEDLYRQALALDPNDPEVLDAFSLWLVFVGRIREALNMRERLGILEPFVPGYNNQIANLMLIDGQNQAAITILQALPARGPRNISLAHAYAAEGRYGEAADTLLAIPLDDRVASRQSIEDAARLLRNAPTKVRAPEALPEFRGQLNYVYAYVGAAERGLEDPERAITEGRFAGLPQFRHLWSPEYASIRKTERFKALVRRLGWVDYWRARGWPDFCRPVGADDFACT
jgi:TolB-like protein/DNA-binding SARP family transcriptional activator/Tfp pilus assembly protein PilF